MLCIFFLTETIANLLQNEISTSSKLLLVSVQGRRKRKGILGGNINGLFNFMFM